MRSNALMSTLILGGGISLACASFAASPVQATEVSSKALISQASSPTSGPASDPAPQNSVQTPPAASSDEDSIRQLLMNLGNYASVGNVNGAMSLWTDDGTLVDESGNETNGKDQLRNRLTEAFVNAPNGKISLHPDRISFAAPNVAIVTASASRKTDAAELPSSKVSMVLVKKDGQWLIHQTSETQIQKRHASEFLNQLAWLVGDWQVLNSTTKLHVEWSESHNFLLSKLISDSNGKEKIDRQIIGWDPQNNSIVSWHFESNGGFGYGKWSRQDKQWRVDFNGTSSRGSKTSASNIFTLEGPDDLFWQSTAQTADDVKIADSDKAQLKRIR